MDEKMQTIGMLILISLIVLFVFLDYRSTIRAIDRWGEVKGMTTVIEWEK